MKTFLDPSHFSKKNYISFLDPSHLQKIYISFLDPSHFSKNLHFLSFIKKMYIRHYPEHYLPLILQHHMGGPYVECLAIPVPKGPIPIYHFMILGPH